MKCEVVCDLVLPNGLCSIPQYQITIYNANSLVTSLILICDKFQYKVVHTSCFLFGNCLRKTSKE